MKWWPNENAPEKSPGNKIGKLKQEIYKIFIRKRYPIIGIWIERK